MWGFVGDWGLSTTCPGWQKHTLGAWEDSKHCQGMIAAIKGQIRAKHGLSITPAPGNVSQKEEQWIFRKSTGSSGRTPDLPFTPMLVAMDTLAGASLSLTACSSASQTRQLPKGDLPAFTLQKAVLTHPAHADFSGHLS